MLSVLGLYDRFFPPLAKHVASFTMAEVTKRVKLSDFTASASNPDAPMRPAPSSAALGLPSTDGRRSDSALLLQAPVEQPPAVLATVVPTKPAPTTATSSPTTKPSTTSTTAAPSARLTWPPTEAFSKSVTSQPALDPYTLPPEMLARMLPPTYLGADGTPPPADDVAKRLSQALAKVESTPSGKKKEPLGWAVAVNVDVEGFDGQPLLLKWSLDGLDVPGSWTTDTVAFRLTPRTPHDVGSFEVWVPNLKGQVAYNVNLMLESEVDRIALTRAKPVALPRP